MMNKVTNYVTKEFRKRLVDGEMAQAGIGLFQMLLAIALFLAFIGAASMMFADAKSKQKIQMAKQNRDVIRTNIQTLFSQVPDFSDLDNTIKGVFPDIMDKTGGYKNGWNGAVTVKPDTDPTRFTIQYTGVPEKECVSLASDSGWLEVKVGSTVIPSDGTAVSAASGACSGDNNTITWTSN
jgi:hypothetical protein